MKVIPIIASIEMATIIISFVKKSVVIQSEGLMMNGKKEHMAVVTKVKISDMTPIATLRLMPVFDFSERLAIFSYPFPNEETANAKDIKTCHNIDYASPFGSEHSKEIVSVDHACYYQSQKRGNNEHRANDYDSQLSF